MSRTGRSLDLAGSSLESSSFVIWDGSPLALDGRSGGIKSTESGGVDKSNEGKGVYIDASSEGKGEAILSEVSGMNGITSSGGRK